MSSRSRTQEKTPCSMKIIVASPYLKWNYAGGSAFPFSLARGLADAGYHVVLLGFGDPSYDREASKRSHGSLVQRWMEDPVARGWGRFPLFDGYTGNGEYSEKCKEVIEEIKPDLVIINSFNRLGTIVEAAHSKNIPVIYIACDLSASCLNEVGLLEKTDERCGGPRRDKCIECQTSQFTCLRFLLSRILRFFLWARHRTRQSSE